MHEKKRGLGGEKDVGIWTVFLLLVSGCVNESSDIAKLNQQIQDMLFRL